MDARIKVARTSTVALLISTFALAIAAPSALAQTETDTRPPARKTAAPAGEEINVRVARLVSDLASPSYAARHAADEELARLGQAAREQIELASRSDDLEVRTRATRLLRQLKVDALWQPSLVQLTANGAPAKEVIAELVKKTDNRLSAGDQFGAFRPGKVTLSSDQHSFWQVVDKVCEQTNNRFRPNYGSGSAGWVLVAGDGGKYPVAYAGPVRARISSARRVFVEEFNYRDTKSDASHTLQFNLQISWEDRFRLVAHHSQLEVATAIDDKGGQTTGTVVPDQDWTLFESNRKQLKMAVRLRPPATTATELETLTLRWPLTAVGDQAVLETNSMAIDETFQQEDATLTIERVRQRGSLWQVTVAVTRDLAVPEPREILFTENEFNLIDDDGNAYPVQSTTKLGLTAGTVRLKLTFSADSAASQAAKLRMRFPRIRDQRDLMITFRNVPLPRAQPK